MDLFPNENQTEKDAHAPLAARMRPRALDEFVGQEHILGHGRLLRRAIQADQLSSLIFYSPPGTGKTTLARIIANTTKAHFIEINAVLAGVKELREVIRVAKEHHELYRRRTILFVDEVHRWNKAQQDALLPWVENGTVIFIGATTENPYFEVIKPLVSRSRVFQLKPLRAEDLAQIAHHALGDRERGYGGRKVRVDEEAMSHLIAVANGDARSLLNALELAVETTDPDREGVTHVDLAVAQESIQRRAVLYDKEGDVHYDTISAFIKSLRGSDPDAALYWMARMVYAGEDPNFILRRMLIFAGEDVGLADPKAICVVTACAQAFEYVGMPEGRFHLAEAALYLATAPKSNSVMAFFDALTTVEKEQEGEVPSHLRDNSRDAEEFGHGVGYLYPHAYRDHWVAQQYLPDFLQGRTFYQPSGQGYEATIAAEVEGRREANLAAMLEENTVAPPEILTFTGGNLTRERDRWLARTISGTGKHLESLRDKVLSGAKPQRHHLILNLNAGTGLFVWECLRRVPEGGVWAITDDQKAAAVLTEQSQHLLPLERPVVICGHAEDLPKLLAERGEGSVRFDVIVGRNCLTKHPDKPQALQRVASLLQPQGVISLAETIPKHTQRLYRLVDLTLLGEELAAKVKTAEEAIYAAATDPMVNWDAADLQGALLKCHFTKVSCHVERYTTEFRITPATLSHWFDGGAGKERPSYGERLLTYLTPEELTQVRKCFTQTLQDQTVRWVSTVAYVGGKNRLPKAGRKGKNREKQS